MQCTSLFNADPADDQKLGSKGFVGRFDVSLSLALFKHNTSPFPLEFPEHISAPESNEHLSAP